MLTHIRHWVVQEHGSPDVVHVGLTYCESKSEKNPEGRWCALNMGLCLEPSEEDKYLDLAHHV